jgi:hypothetical protein
MKRIYVINFSETLAENVSDSDTSFDLSDASGLGTIGAGEYIAATLDNGAGVYEIIHITAVSTDTITCTRGEEGTAAVNWSTGDLIEVRTTADSYHLKQDQIANSDDEIDFGAATSLEIPNSSAPTVNATGEIALDTTVTDYADGFIKYYSGSTEYGLVAMPTASFGSPTNGHVVTYDSTTDKFKLAAGGSGSQTPWASTIDTAGYTLTNSSTADGVEIESNNGIHIIGPHLNLIPQGTGSPPQLRLYEDGDNGSNWVGFVAPASLAGNNPYEMPASYPAGNRVLQSTNAGILSWVSMSSGDVAGPASSTDNAAARFDSTTGKIIQDSLLIIADTTGNISGFQKASASVSMTVGGNSTASGYVEFLEDSDNGSNKITVTAPSAITSDKTITWPDSTGTVVLTSTSKPVIQRVYTQTGAVATGSTLIPGDDTIPQITEGNEYMTLAITPTNSSNILQIQVTVSMSSNTGAVTAGVALFQDATANALAANWHTTPGAGFVGTITFTHTMVAGTTSATTFRVRMGPASAMTMTFNGQVSGRIYGGVMASSIIITEYQV